MSDAGQEASIGRAPAEPFDQRGGEHEDAQRIWQGTSTTASSRGTTVNAQPRPIVLVLPRHQTPISTKDMWLGMGATLVVMAALGLWFVGLL